jgi:hypothetical protein
MADAYGQKEEATSYPREIRGEFMELGINQYVGVYRSRSQRHKIHFEETFLLLPTDRYDRSRLCGFLEHKWSRFCSVQILISR